MMTMREKMARAICERNVDGDVDEIIAKHPPMRRWEAWLEDADAVLDVLSGDPGHDATALVVEPTGDRSEALRIWDGIITAIKEGA